VKPYYQDSAVTIYHGDAREVISSVPAVDMIFTDPPYGHNNNDGDLIHRREGALGREATEAETAPRPIANDDPKQAAELFEWLVRECAPGWLRGGGCCCCCCGGGGGPDPQFARWSLIMDGPLEFKQMVVWDKGPIGMGWHYRRSYETVLVGMKRPGPCAWFDETDRVENIIRDIPKQIPQAFDHPTPKPPALAARFIGLHTRIGGIVLDPFCGAGSTLRAAKDMGRRAVGIEIDERWCEMAARRMAQEVLPLGLDASRVKA
jgi:site-specific DNA-methyltransferase (adenine-specific)